jgi:hypothetical protein
MTIERSRRTLVIVGALLVTALIIGSLVWAVTGNDSSSDAARPSPAGSVPPTTTITTQSSVAVAGATTGLVLDPNHDYGDEYADGILPVGDGKYSTDAPSTGTVYVCRAPQGAPGAPSPGTRGSSTTTRSTT